MKFVHQTMMINGQPKVIGLSSNKLKSLIENAFNVHREVGGVEVQTQSFVGGKYDINYSDKRDINNFLSEKDMTIQAELTVRYRPANTFGSLSINQVLTVMRGGGEWGSRNMHDKLLSQLYDVVVNNGGTLFGESYQWMYMPIHKTDTPRLTEMFKNNSWEFLPNFFRGEDIPSTAFGCVSNCVFSKSSTPYLKTSSTSRSNHSNIRLIIMGILNKAMDSCCSARLILGLTGEFDTDFYDSTSGRANPGRIIPGPSTEQLVRLVHEDVAASGVPSMWLGVRPFDNYPESEDPEMDQWYEDDYEEEEEDF
jgi:hypothetical protein